MAAWDRLPAETAAAHDAFRTYMLLPVRERSIDAAYRATRGQQEGNDKRAIGRWNKWSTDHDWVARAAAYDKHHYDLELEEIEQRKREQRELEWQIAKAGLELVRDALPHAQQFIHSQRRVIPAHDGQPEQVIITLSFDMPGLSASSERFGKQGRLSNEQPTEHIQLSGAALQSIIEAEFRRLAHVDDNGATSTPALLTADEAEFDDLATDGDGEV